MQVRVRPDVRNFDNDQWALFSALLIQDALDGLLAIQQRCSVMLTGGRGAARLYREWARLPSFRQLDRVDFFFCDERCVPPDDPGSNYGMATRTLFGEGIPNSCSVFRMEGECRDYSEAASRYELLMPKQIDLLLLGVGDDGHIASLFPRSVSLKESVRRVIDINGPLPFKKRLTVTSEVIKQSKTTFVLASGPPKAEILSKVMKDPDDFFNLPACIVLNATWLLDSELKS